MRTFALVAWSLACAVVVALDVIHGAVPADTHLLLLTGAAALLLVEAL